MKGISLLCMWIVASALVAVGAAAAARTGGETSGKVATPLHGASGPVAVEIVRVPAVPEEEKRQLAAERHEKAEADMWLVRLTGVLAVGTVVLAVATGFLWWATRRLVQGAERTSERQLRAYVSVESCDFAIVGSEAKVVLHVRNFGQTPAYEVCTGSVVHIQPSSEAFNMAAREIEERGQIGILGPTAHHVLSVGTELPSPEFVSALGSGEASFYLVGSMSYVDCFGVKRRQQFRLRNQRGPTGQWAMSTDGNTAEIVV